VTDFTQQPSAAHDPARAGSSVGPGVGIPGVGGPGRKRAAGRKRKSPLPLVWLLGMTVLVIALAAGALWGISLLDKGGQAPEARATTFNTKADYGIRDDAGVGSGVVSNLKAGSTVSARPAQQIDNEQWYEVTTIDGTVGFMPQSMLERFSGGPGDAKVTGGLRAVEVSAMVHLRQAPSLSAAIVGTADAGTRLTADGVVEAEGERWLRVPLTSDLTAFVVERYTQAGNDRVTEREFDQNAGAVGAAGTVRELTNLVSSPLPEARVLKALRAGETVRVIGQTRADRWWYVVLLDDGSQGFVLREAVAVSAAANRYVYSDGTAAPGPTVRRADAEAMRRAGRTGSGAASSDSGSSGGERRQRRQQSSTSGADGAAAGSGDGATASTGDTGVADGPAPAGDTVTAAPDPAPAPAPAPENTGDTGVIPGQ
jgi:hypothetical protein